MQSYQASPSAMNAIPQDRPTTDLEDIQKRFYQAVAEAESLAARLSAMLVRVRGALPPSPEKPPTPHAVANGVIEELRQTESRLGVAHQAAKSVLEMIETAV